MKSYDTLYLKIPGAFKNDPERVERAIDSLSVVLESMKDRYELNEHEFTQILNHFSSHYHNLLTAEVYEWKERVGDILMREMDYISQRENEIRDAYKNLSKKYERLETRFHKQKEKIEPPKRKNKTKRSTKPIPEDL